MHPIFGRVFFHTGVDIPGYIGAPVKATAIGVVRSAGWNGGYGKMVVVDHGYGLSTVYAHLNHFLVKPGDKVVKGQTIAQCGSTGLSTGPHVHYEVRYGNKTLNPRPFIDMSIFNLERVIGTIG